MLPEINTKFCNTPFKKFIAYCQSWTNKRTAEDLKELKDLFVQIDPDAKEEPMTFDKNGDSLAAAIKSLLMTKNIQDEDFFKKLICLFIKKGADLTALDNQGHVLHACILADQDRQEYFDMFLKKFLEQPEEVSAKLINAQDTAWKQTPLHFAIEFNKPDYVTKLLALKKQDGSRMVDLNIKDKDGNTAYMLMCKKENVDPKLKKAIDVAIEEDRASRWQAESQQQTTKSHNYFSQNSWGSSLHARKGYQLMPQSDSPNQDKPKNEASLLDSIKKLWYGFNH